ncbi:tRNA (adenosine(37)-N6)-threonylcarbamoyltransferase complex transferase subunit TsaD [Alicyclobacillus sp. SO9]|uniref:tRNA (adenosine(37)-N6)-threonylcarbamoyltransferase complex transferase subunit TsaD n=1 Tax=Alicyclobacillus sp. SO9 TaxID=2665646 RepID=UPI0018E8C09F|nr:tRNA (adenosine(37)-N6)-threonylcarbamoyltransferase complex transferase subunit TsaD [Alicyclobacillus sp. SO9]QQE78604.1 tRNA (adenosine(37)-N6)-threonylcarbamoyltransferase complex transferase subunit TsaD [Alicyclobacillus sp. SO9]
MKLLGIETSCDETAAAVVEDGRKIISETVASQIDVHAQFGGVVPEVASRKHVQSITYVIEQTLRQGGVSLQEMDGIAVTCGPGLLGSLLVGLSAAKGLSLATGLPLIGVHHIAGHVAAAFLETEQALPVLALVVSGGHTELLKVDENFVFTKMGGTIDDAAGEAYDKVARLLGFPYPGGPMVDKLAVDGNPGAYHFPRSLLDEDSFQFSFSGLKTAVYNEVNKVRQKGGEAAVEDVSASFQAAVIDVLVHKTVRAVQTTGLQTVIVAGGVAANTGLRTALYQAGQEHGFSVVFPDLSHCSDNAAMIAAAGYYSYKRGLVHDLSLNAYAVLPLDKWQRVEAVL